MKPLFFYFSDLPEDLQILICDFVEDALGISGVNALLSHKFTIHRVLLNAFPVVDMWTDYRDESYTEAMIGQDLPPVVLCGEQWPMGGIEYGLHVRFNKQ